MCKKDISDKISEIIVEALKCYFDENLPEIPFPDDIPVQVTLTKDKQHGDMATNIAMRLASVAKRSPKMLAEGISQSIKTVIDRQDGTDYVSKVEVKGGFINFWLSDRYYTDMLNNIKEAKEKFGSSDHGKGIRINLEYVSANPTGPLTIAHGRQAAIGDALSRILRFSGYDVTNEYYLNDFGRQIDMLGLSVKVRYKGLFGKDENMPEDGYMGDYIIDIAEEIKEKDGDKYLEDKGENDRYFSEYAVEYMMKLINKDLDDFKVHFDEWTSQSLIEERKDVGKMIDLFRDKGFVYDDDGATWFRSTDLGDDKDRVLIKGDGSYTYLAPDIAYHNDKFNRGYDKLIDLLGPDHHGYIKRMKAAVQVLGHTSESLDILIVQLVTLLRSGETVSMSTRKGEFVSLREVLDEIGTDVTRFFFLMRKLDSHLDFDLDLAKKESEDNPVFYIQYAHARICSISKFSTGQDTNISSGDADLGLLVHDSEKNLIRKLDEFKNAVSASAENLEPSRLITYLNELAALFHSFYGNCRVVSDEEGLTRARLFLVECVKIVLANGLDLLNITLPEKM